MSAPQAITFGKRRAALGTTPENVLGAGFVPGLVVPTAADLYEKHYVNSNHVPAPADQRLELERARTINAVVARRQQDRIAARKLMAGAALAEALGELDHTDPKFELNRARLYTQYAEGADSQAVKSVDDLKGSNFDNHRKAIADHREAAYKSLLSKRVGPLLGSDAIPFPLKNQLLDRDGNFDLDAIEKAEAIHSASGGKDGAEFYSKLRKDHGLTRADLDLVVANPALVTYHGVTGQVSSETVAGQESQFRARGTLPNGGVLDLPLDKFGDLVVTHKNLSRQGAVGVVAPSQSQERAFSDRQTQEASAKTNGLPLITAPPAGYAEWLAKKTAPASTSKSAAEELALLLGKAPLSLATPAATQQQPTGSLGAAQKSDTDEPYVSP